MIHWTAVSPIVASVFVANGVRQEWRKWRADEEDVTELLKMVAVGVLCLGVGVEGYSHPSTAIIVCACLGGAQLLQVVRRLGTKRSSLPAQEKDTPRIG